MDDAIDSKSQTDSPVREPLPAPPDDAYFYNWEEIHKAREKGVAVLTATAEKVGDLVVICDPQGTLKVTRKVKTDDPQQLIDFIGTYHLFRKNYADDDLDIISFLIDPKYLDSMGGGSTPIYNNTEGIGLPITKEKYRPAWSSKRLLHHTHHTAPFTLRGMLHELGHLWLAYVDFADKSYPTRRLLHEDFPYQTARGQPQRDQAAFHWGRWVDHGNSSMSYDRHEWRDNGDGTYTSISHWADEALGTYFGYSKLDQYLMGLIPSKDVGNSFVLVKPEPPLPDPDDLQSSGPHRGKTQVSVSVKEVIELHGMRKPDHESSQRVFRQGFCIITSSEKVDAAFLGQCQNIIRMHEMNFRRATSGRAVVDTRLLMSNHTTIGIGSNQGGNNGLPDIWVRNKNDKKNGHESPKSGKSNWINVRIHNDSAEDYDSATVNVYAAEGSAGAFQYPDDWRPDRLIGSRTVPIAKSSDRIVAVEWRPGLVPADQYGSAVLLAELMPLDPNLRKREEFVKTDKLAIRRLDAA